MADTKPFDNGGEMHRGSTSGEGADKGVVDGAVHGAVNGIVSGVLQPEGFMLPNNWKYRRAEFGEKRFPWYASPKVQLILVSFVCFLCPGMFNAVNGLGGGGQVDSKANDDALTALYATFSVVGFFAGTFANKLGVRITLAFGGFGYCIYVAALLCYNHTLNAGFLIFAGALLGVCAGLLWTAQGAIMMSYPQEHAKGRYISWFWMIFNMGAVIGSLVSPNTLFEYPF